MDLQVITGQNATSSGYLLQLVYPGGATGELYYSDLVFNGCFIDGFLISMVGTEL